MDWYSWLSKTNLEPKHVYEYGQAFVRNELEEDDLTYFNHEFLQSIGISVAKHRLEILKLTKKESKHGSINRLFNKARKLISKLSSPMFPNTTAAPDRSPHQNHWSGALRRISTDTNAKTNGANQNQQDQKSSVVVSKRNVMWSGPLDKRVPQHNYMLTSSLSGPLDGKTHQDWSPVVPGSTERLGFYCRSPTVSGPIRLGLSPQPSYNSSGKFVDRDEAKSLWSLMFQDMKPT